MGTPTSDPEKLFEDEAKENREIFLKPYFERYKRLKRETSPKSEKKIAAIIAELIKMEPSHLAEPWILWTVIEWMGRRECKDFLQAAIMDEKGRDRRTEKQQRKLVLDFIFIQKVDRLRKESSCSIEKACEILAKSNQAGEDPASNLIKKYYKERNAYRQMCEQRDENRKVMPFPYHGRDYRPYI